MADISTGEVEALFSKINRLLENLSPKQYGLLAAVFKIADDIMAGELKFDVVAFSEAFEKSFTPLEPLAPFLPDTTQMILAYAEAAADKNSFLGSSIVKGLSTGTQSAKPAMIVKSATGHSTDSDE